MPNFATGSSESIFANSMVPSMPMSTRVASNTFGPFQFKNSHIPLSNPSLGGAFGAQYGAQGGSVPLMGSGFFPPPYTQFGNNTSMGMGFVTSSSNPFGNSLPQSGGYSMFGSNPYYSSNQQPQF